MAAHSTITVEISATEVSLRPSNPASIPNSPPARLTDMAMVSCTDIADNELAAAERSPGTSC